MHRLLLCASLLVNMMNIDEVYIEGIEYSSTDSSAEYVTLDIDLYSSRLDIIEMQVYFYNADKEIYEKFYASSLSIIGREQTAARIPFNVGEKTYLVIKFYSDNIKDFFESVVFPIYPRNEGVCNLSEFYCCESELPVTTRYHKGVIYEEKEKIVLINKQLKYFAFDNKLPLKKISLSSSFEVEGYANLVVKSRIEEFDIYYNNGYVFPLSLSFKNNIVSFNFENNYYLDILEGKVSEEYLYGSYYTNQVLFPYKDEEYDISVEFINVHSSFEKIVIDFKVVTKGSLLGDCNVSKYCLRRNYL